MSIDALNGDEAMAHGVRLSRAKLIAIYPITPQTIIGELLSTFVAEGQLDARYVTSEGEHGMMGTIMGAAATGIRTFTATSSQGFAFGFENIAMMPGLRVPTVMAVVNRSLALPTSIACDHSDSMTARDLGWVQLYTENNQEALDTIIQAYRIAEDPRALLPVMVCMDGLVVSHTTEMIDVPEQNEVDSYLPIRKQNLVIADPDTPMEIGGPGSPIAENNMAQEWLQNEALLESKLVIKEANEAFREGFGRGYGDGAIETIECDDADVILVTMGSMTSNARLALEELRDAGKRVGLLKIRCFRPFPTEEVVAAVREAKAIAVLDRCATRGVPMGPVATEISSALYGLDSRPKILGFTVGLHGAEIRVSDIEYIANKALTATSSESGVRGSEWVPRMDVTVKVPSVTKRREEICHPGITACPGCPMALAVRHTLERLGSNTVALRTVGCLAWQSSLPDTTGVSIPLVGSALPSGGATATGVAAGLKMLGRDDVNVILLGGDGSVGDMGFGALSGAAHRNEDFICMVIDNESYALTGIQRSGSTPRLAWTTTTPVGSSQSGNSTARKDLPMIMAAHGVPYVATLSVAYLEDFYEKLEKARTINGFRYLHVYAPCPTSWKFPTELTIKLARLGVATGVHNIYEIDGGRVRMTINPAPLKPVSDFLRLQGRFSHLKDEDFEMVQAAVSRTRGELQRWEESGLVLPTAAF